MKFSNFLFFASVALAAPAADKDLEVRSAKLEARQQQSNNAVNVIYNSLVTLDGVVSSSTTALTTAASQARAGVYGELEVQLRATFKANYQLIASALVTAGQQISGATVGAAGGLGNTLTGFTKESLVTLTLAIQILIRILSNIRIVLSIAYSDISWYVLQYAGAEVANVRQSVAGVVVPTAAFLAQVRTFAVSIGLNIDGLNQAVTGLTQIGALVSGYIGIDLFPKSGPGSLPGIGTRQ